jgi:hypothetical protein
MADSHMSHDEVSLHPPPHIRRDPNDLPAALFLTSRQFFAKLGELFNHRKGSDHGAIYLSQKRRTCDNLQHLSFR